MPRRLEAPLGGSDGTDHRAIVAPAKVMTSLNTRTAPSIRVMASTAPVPSPKRIPDEGFRKECNKAARLALVDRVFRVKRIFRVSYKAILGRLLEYGAVDNSGLFFSQD